MGGGKIIQHNDHTPLIKFNRTGTTQHTKIHKTPFTRLLKENEDCGVFRSTSNSICSSTYTQA